jgi:tripartite-type tricarboxylate transporter receptor subunit TctC
MLTRRRLGAAAFGGAVAASPRVARAQVPWPTERPVEVIVPFPPGGGVDAMARLFLPAWSGCCATATR